MSKNPLSIEFQIVCPSAPLEVAVELPNGIRGNHFKRRATVPVSELTKEQKDALALEWRKMLDSPQRCDDVVYRDLKIIMTPEQAKYCEAALRHETAGGQIVPRGDVIVDQGEGPLQIKPRTRIFR